MEKHDLSLSLLSPRGKKKEERRREERRRERKRREGRGRGRGGRGRGGRGRGGRGREGRKDEAGVDTGVNGIDPVDGNYRIERKDGRVRIERKEKERNNDTKSAPSSPCQSIDENKRKVLLHVLTKEREKELER